MTRELQPLIFKFDNATWTRVVEKKLYSWLADPSVLEDEDRDAPSQEILRLAIQFSDLLQKNNFPCPNSVLPDASGGIVFEWRVGVIAASYHIWDDGSIEFIRINDSEIVERQVIHGPEPRSTQIERQRQGASMSASTYWKFGAMAATVASVCLPNAAQLSG